MKIIDLHTHSNYSDGTFSPSSLVLHAKSAGLSAIALTDHDTVQGIDEAKDAGKKNGIEVIEGVEMAAEYKRREIHILGYFIDYKCQRFTNGLRKQIEIREERNEKLIKRLRSLNLPVNAENLNALSDGKTVTRLHFAKVLYEKGFAKSVKDAFAKYLEEGRPAFVGRNALDYGECIEIINGAGGIAVLAHPYSYKFAGGEVTRMIMELKDAGVGGVEAIYPYHNSRQTAAIMKAANALDLKITGGSDFHGENRPNVKIGTGTDGNISVGYDVLEALRERR